MRTNVSTIQSFTMDRRMRVPKPVRAAPRQNERQAPPADSEKKFHRGGREKDDNE